MGFAKRFYALCKKNFILYRRNWMGSLCEICCPILLMSMIVVARLIVTKELIEETTQIDSAYIMTDPASSTPTSSQEFMGLKASDYEKKVADNIKFVCDGSGKAE